LHIFAAMPSSEPFVIAVIDDDPSVRQLLNIVVKRAGAIVLEAGTLAEGERILREYPWDVAVIDRRLPDGDGLELCKLVTAGTVESHRYVVILSGLQSHEEKMRGFEAGADEYIGKPIDPGEFAARLRGIRRSVTSQKTLMARLFMLEQLSVMDAMTQVYNYRFFDAEIRRYYDLAVRHQRALALAMVDLDHFKKVNDTFGHRIGDQVLIEISNMIAQGIRSSDILARYGGEEFAVILPETNLEEAFMLAERLRGSIAGSILDVTNGPTHLTVSIGVAAVSPHIGTPVRLVESADRALYIAKTEGRKCVRRYRPDADERRETWHSGSNNPHHPLVVR
jgi:two-component system cell cycle response regulator